MNMNPWNHVNFRFVAIVGHAPYRYEDAQLVLVLFGSTAPVLSSSGSPSSSRRRLPNVDLDGVGGLAFQCQWMTKNGARKVLTNALFRLSVRCTRVFDVPPYLFFSQLLEIDE